MQLSNVNEVETILFVLFMSAEANNFPAFNKEAVYLSSSNSSKDTLLQDAIPSLSQLRSVSVGHALQGTQVCITSLSLHIPLLRIAAPTFRRRKALGVRASYSAHFLTLDRYVGVGGKLKETRSTESARLRIMPDHQNRYNWKIDFIEVQTGRDWKIYEMATKIYRGTGVVRVAEEMKL